MFLVQLIVSYFQLVVLRFWWVFLFLAFGGAVIAFQNNRNPFAWFVSILVCPFALAIVLLVPKVENVMMDARDVNAPDGKATPSPSRMVGWIASNS